MSHHHLPPDLERIGDELTAAVDGRLRARRRRNLLIGRLAVTGIAAALGLAALSPGPLGIADRHGDAFDVASTSTTAYVPAACDQPRGATFAAARPCGPPGATDAALTLERRMAMR